MRRSRLDLKMDVLKKVEAEGPIGATRLSKAANVNSARLTRMLSTFEKNGVVKITREDRGSRRPYHKQVSLTAKGLRVLRDHESLMKSLGEAG